MGISNLKSNKLLRRLLIAVLMMLVFIFSSIISFLFLKYIDPLSKNEVNIEILRNPVEVGPEYKKPFAVLLLGYGGAGHDGGGLSDSINVIYVDPEKKSATLIAIPRDIWLEIPVRSDAKESHKINQAFVIGGSDTKYPLKEPLYVGEHGGGEMAKYAATIVTDLPIKHYVAVNFGGFVQLIDLLGGIEVNVPVAFDDYFYPVKGKENESCGKSGEEIASLTQTLSGFELEKQFECRYEHLHFDSGVQKMDGQTTLKFVRSRHSDQHGGDFARGVRQQAVLDGIKNKLLKLNVRNKADDLFERLSGVIKTDLTLETAMQIIEVVSSPDDFDIKKVNLSEENTLNSSVSSDGQFILIPKAGIGNWSEIHNLIDSEISNI